MPPDGPVGIVGEGPDAIDAGDRGEGAERLTGVGALEGVSRMAISCVAAASRLGGAAPHEPVSGRVTRSLPKEPLPPLML